MAGKVNPGNVGVLEAFAAGFGQGRSSVVMTDGSDRERSFATPLTSTTRVTSVGLHCWYMAIAVACNVCLPYRVVKKMHRFGDHITSKKQT